MSERVKNVLSIGALFVLILLFYGRLLYPQAKLIVTPDFGKSDSWHSSISAKILLAEKLHANQFPLWSQKIGTGVPVFAEGLIGAAFLPNLIIFRLFDPVTAIALSYILSAIILGSGMYVWTRAMGLSALPAFLGAVTVTFSGITIPQLTHLPLLPAQALIPWVLWATHELALKKTPRRYVGVLAAIVGQQILTGYPQAVFIGLLFAMLYYFSLQRNKLAIRPIILGILALTLAIGGAAIQLVPSQEYLRQSTVPEGYAPQMARFFSYPLRHLKTLLDPFALGNPKEGTYPSFIQLNGSIFWENSGYVGILPLLALSLYLILRVTGRRIGNADMFLMALAVSLLLMFGKFSPLYIVYSFWPFTLFRVPSRFVWMFVIALSMIFVRVAHEVWRRCESPLAKSLFIFVSLLHIIQLFVPWWNYHALERAAVWLTPPKTASSLPPGDRVLTIGAETTHNKEFLTYGWKDMAPYNGLRNALQPNSNIAFGVSQHESYIGRSLRRNTLVDSMLVDHIPQTQQEATVSATGKKLLDVFSINSVISTLPLTTALQLGASIKEGNIRIDTYPNPDALPKSYLATIPIVVTSAEEAGRVLSGPDFHPGKSVLVEEEIGLTATTTKASQRVFDDDRIVVATQSNGTAILVIAMTYYPGWLATIDGKNAQTIPVNIRQTGVVVPPGIHTVKLMYRPVSFTIGTAISGVSWIIIVFLIVFPPPSEGYHSARQPRRLSRDL